MHITQRDGQQPLDTLRVWYEGTEELLPGYSVCYDVAAALTEGSDGFNEKIRGRQVVKPATANLEYYAGVVVDPPRKNGDPGGTYKGWCTIAPLRRGQWVKALVYKASSNTALNEVLQPVNAQWYLGADAQADTLLPASTGVGRYSRTSVAVVGEALDCDPAANCLIMGIHG
jgi:hypothetical protein